MDKNHCAKCIHLKKNKDWKEKDHGNSISAEGFFPGFYVCYIGGRFWSNRPKRDFNICEHFAKNKTQLR